MTIEENSFRILTDNAKTALAEAGWDVRKAPGLGRSNVWDIKKKDVSGKVSIRTTRNRWIAYQPQNGGASWKTLDSVDFVCISAFDRDPETEEPVGVSVHLVDATEIRKSFVANYQARIDEGHVVTDDFGMWVCMDPLDPQYPAFVGSGLATEENLIARYSLDASGEIEEKEVGPTQPTVSSPVPTSVSEVLQNACAEISRVTGIAVEKISLDLHLKT